MSVVACGVIVAVFRSCWPCCWELFFMVLLQNSFSGVFFFVLL